MTDRKPEGCIGNGLTRNEEDLANLGCGTELLHGYSLPATSIVMNPNGGHGLGMIDRNNPSNVAWYDPDCANYPGDTSIDGTSYDNNPNGNDKKNFIEFGSETPHQLGWYLIMLATEYALLGQNGQHAEQQRTLEELFLALQAYRRLDISANCLVQQRYDEITQLFEVCPDGGNVQESCLCMPKYKNAQCNASDWYFFKECRANCPWTLDLSGYSGFFIREDATQEQEILHDPSEDRWNIDLVSSVFAMSHVPPCSSNFSPPCYMEKHTGYLSQDQLFSVMTGLAVAKHYIPPAATVTTCNGQTYKPFDIIQDIAKGFVELPQNSTRHIFWPGSEDNDCCEQAIKFSQCVGGNFQWTYAGVEYMYNYINEGEDDHHIGLIDRNKWGPSLGRKVWFAASMGVSIDVGDMPNPIKFVNAALDSEKEIYLLINDLLHPEEPNLVGEGDEFDGLHDYFRQLLCTAPCGGPCIKPYNYDAIAESDANESPQVIWPDFECSNTPDWTGQRWEGNSGGPDWAEEYRARQFNGLDFMALYNLYLLRYPNEQTTYYYNPEMPDPFPAYLYGEDKIEGPTTLCPGQTGMYKLPLTPEVDELSVQWSSSPNILIDDLGNFGIYFEADATVINAHMGWSCFAGHFVKSEFRGYEGLIFGFSTF
jgi:hypothetical protein